MKVNFVVTHLSHGSPGSFYRPYEIVKELSNQGINAKIFTPFEQDVKNFKDIQMKLLPNISSKLFVSNFVYNRLRNIIYNKYISKLVSYDKFLKSSSDRIAKSLDNLENNSPDIIQAEQEVAALACLKFGKKNNIPVVVDVHNIWPEELVSFGLLKQSSQVFKNLMNLEKEIIEGASAIIAVNDFMKDYLVSNFNADKKNIIVIPPGGELIYKDDIDILNTQRFQSKKIVYAGLVNPREHVDLFVKSIPHIKKAFPKTEFIISEKGENVKEIKNLCKQLKINPRFYWHQSREKARQMLKTCYVGALPSRDDIPRKLGTPLKLLEYISNLIPVVANDVGSWCNLIKKHEIGILTNDDPKEFSKAILTLLSDEDLYRKMQINMINLLKDAFSWKNHVGKTLIPLYQKISS